MKTRTLYTEAGYSFEILIPETEKDWINLQTRSFNDQLAQDGQWAWSVVPVNLSDPSVNIEDLVPLKWPHSREPAPEQEPATDDTIKCSYCGNPITANQSSVQGVDKYYHVACHVKITKENKAFKL